MKTMPTKAKPSKAAVKVKPLSPRKDPKGGKTPGGGCDDEFGCAGNHNEIVAVGGIS
jgi:hypothetical protein